MITYKTGDIELPKISPDETEKVLYYPNKLIRNVAIECLEDDVKDEEFRKLVARLANTMYKNDGVGIASTQVGFSKRIIVVDTGWTSGTENPQVLVNPKLVSVSDNTAKFEEGCLSVPLGYRAMVERAKECRVVCKDLDWNDVEIDAEGLESACLQHEIDHLDGILFIDRISRLKRDMYDRKLNKKIKQVTRMFKVRL